MKRGQVSIEVIAAVAAVIVILMYFLYTTITWNTENANNEKEYGVQQTCENMRHFLTSVYNSLDGYYSVMNLSTNYRIRAYKTELVLIEADNPYFCNYKGIIKECDIDGVIYNGTCNITSSGILEAWNKDGYIYLKFTSTGDEIPSMTTLTIPATTTTTSTTTMTSTSSTTSTTTTTTTITFVIKLFNSGGPDCNCTFSQLLGQKYCDNCSFTIPANGTVTSMKMNVTGGYIPPWTIVHREYGDLQYPYPVYADNDYFYYSEFSESPLWYPFIHVLNKTSLAEVALFQGCDTVAPPGNQWDSQPRGIVVANNYIFATCSDYVRVWNRNTFQFVTDLVEPNSIQSEIKAENNKIYVAGAWYQLNEYNANT
jgi:hypothetical protein